MPVSNRAGSFHFPFSLQSMAGRRFSLCLTGLWLTAEAGYHLMWRNIAFWLSEFVEGSVGRWHNIDLFTSKKRREAAPLLSCLISALAFPKLYINWKKVQHWFEEEQKHYTSMKSKSIMETLAGQGQGQFLICYALNSAKDMQPPYEYWSTIG